MHGCIVKFVKRYFGNKYSHSLKKLLFFQPKILRNKKYCFKLECGLLYLFKTTSSLSYHFNHRISKLRSSDLSQVNLKSLTYEFRAKKAHMTVTQRRDEASIKTKVVHYHLKPSIQHCAFQCFKERNLGFRGSCAALKLNVAPPLTQRHVTDVT